MRVIITDSYERMGLEAANIVAGQIYLKPDSVLGLATGSTPVSMYERLVAVHKTVGLDFSEVTTFNLDEYIGMSPDNPQSYHYFMQENFFRHINIRGQLIRAVQIVGHSLQILCAVDGCQLYPAGIQANLAVFIGKFIQVNDLVFRLHRLSIGTGFVARHPQETHR